MVHPDMEQLAEIEPEPDVALHLVACATCRADRQLFLEAFGADSLTAERFLDTGGDPASLAAQEGAPLGGERFPREHLLHLAALLADLHRGGLSYGDLHPSDVRVQSDGRIVLRSPRPAPPEAATGAVALGRAPEHRGGGRSPAGDRFALGMLMRGLAAQSTDAPKEISALCAALTAEDPAARPDDAEVLSTLALLPAATGTRYPVHGVLGAGGMGEVLRVFDPLLRREVALKRLHTRLGANPGHRKRFVSESQTIAQLQHPGIVPVFERGSTDEGAPYYTMPVVEGRTLTEVIAEFRAAVRDHRWPDTEGLSLHRLVFILRQAAEAVGYAHSRGVLHRDLKPDNIMVGAFGEVWVMDWGLARVSGQPGLDQAVTTERSAERLSTRLGTVAGTPAYMSPEQAEGGALDSRTDVYALGAVLYQILCGELPYGQTSPGETLSALRSASPPPLKTRVGPDHPPVPEDLREICEQAMDRAPQGRFDDGGSLARALSGWLEGAERRQRARAILTEARSIRSQAEARRRELLELRARAAGTSPDELWTLVDELRRGHAQAQDLDRTAHQRFEAALVLDPSSWEAHEALGDLHRARWQAAVRDRQPARAEDAEARMRAHLAALPQAHPLRSEIDATDLRAARGRLPAPQGAGLAGRADALQTLEQWDQGPGRLLTLVGTAGSGKTRLATHFARHHLAAPAVFCDLAPARSADDIVARVAQALDLRLGHGDASAQVARALGERGELVLILDNLEQIVTEAGDLVAGWLDVAPALGCLGTSRIRLGLADEQLVELDTLDPLAAAEMFERVGRLSRPAFRLRERNLPAVLELVAALDHLPLAIELAAARLGSLGLSGIQTWLKDRFVLLRSGLRDPSARALEAALEASWALLSPTEQRALAACSVFVGGWDLPSAEAVLRGDERATVPELLDALVEDHLVVRQRDDSDSSGARFTLLESVRVFAGSKLDQAGGAASQRAEVEDRHTAWFTAQALALPELAGAAHTQLARHTDNTLAAIRRAVARGDADLASAAWRTSWAAIAQRRSVQQGVAMAEELLALEGLGSLEGALLQHAAGRLLLDNGTPKAAEAMQRRAIATLQSENAEHELCRALNHLGLSLWRQDRIDEARAALEEAIEVAAGCGVTITEAYCNGALAVIDKNTMRTEDSLRRFGRSLALHRQLDNRRGIAMCLGDMGAIEESLGRLDEAEAMITEAVEILAELRDRRGESVGWGELGHVRVAQGRLDEADHAFDRAQALAREGGFPNYLASHLVHHATVARLQGRPDAALARLEEARAICRELPIAESPTRTLLNLALIYAERGEGERARALVAELDDAGREAGLDGDVIDPIWRAELALRLGSRESAQDLCSQARSALHEAGLSLRSEHGWYLTRLEALLDADASEPSEENP